MDQLSSHNLHISEEVDHLINDKSALEALSVALLTEVRAFRLQAGDTHWVPATDAAEEGPHTVRIGLADGTPIQVTRMDKPVSVLSAASTQSNDPEFCGNDSQEVYSFLV